MRDASASFQRDENVLQDSKITQNFDVMNNFIFLCS